jgi:pyruvate dehydrogenase E2 component (dihydrolipoamide acetyltransferase)
MRRIITMPALSDTMGAGRLIKWTRKSGDRIKKGDIIAEVETDKAAMDVEAFQDGYLSGPLAEEGTEAPIGQVIGYIADNASEISNVEAATAQAPQTPSGDGKTPAASAHETPPVSAVLTASMATARPAAVRRAPHALGVSQTNVEAGTHRAATTSPLLTVLAAGPPYRVERPSSLREAVARNMIASAATPTFRVTAQLPLQPLMTAANERRQSLTLMLARACALTAVAHPLFNAAYTPDGLARRDRVDIGIAVDNGDGLITPVLRDAAARPFAELAEAWNSLRERVKSRRLTPADYTGATFYLSNLGQSSVVFVFDSIVPPGASAILSVAALHGQGAFVTLACDHRVVFGIDAVRFLETLGERLKELDKLLT